MLPFRRIAILEPSQVFPRNLTVLSHREIIAFTRDWSRRVLRHGADACYLRMHTDVPQVSDLIACLDAHGPAHLLLSSSLVEFAQPHHGLHFRGQAPLITSSSSFRGRSCHSLVELQAASDEGIDYGFYSPIFATATHPEAEPLGITALEKACTSVALPIFALGGLDAERSQTCMEAGAYGVAGIRMFMG